MRRLLSCVLFALVVWLQPLLAWAALSVLGSPTSSSATSVASGAYTAFTYTVSAGSNRVLILWVGTGDGEIGAASAVTYGGQSMTALWDIDNADFIRSQAWYLKETGIAAAASTTFSITLTHNTDALMLGVAAFQDAIQDSTTFGTAAEATGTSSTPSVTVTSASGELVIAGMITEDSAAFSQGGTLLFELEGIFSDVGAGGQYYNGAASVNAQWTTANIQWVTGGVSIRPAGAAAAASPRLLLLGVGGIP